MKKTSRFHGALLAAAACFALAACGGGGGGDDDDAPPGGPDAPPASAGMTSQGFLAFIASLANRNFDRSTPYELGMFEAPESDETAAPIATSVDQ